jgi:hypothetical protein
MPKLPAQAPQDPAPVTSGQIHITLPSESVVLPLSAYDKLLAIALAVEGGEYIPRREFEAKVAEAVRRALRTMNDALMREAAKATSSVPEVPYEDAEPESQVLGQ